jgi:UDPglucose 6-dehydrogenase
VAEQTVAIVGYGAVGRGIHTLFPQAVIYDEPLGIGERSIVNAARHAFVCVPTPERPDGGCDTSVVEDVVSWIGSEVIIVRSTVPPGTSERLAAATGKRIVFQPEYGPAETPDHPFSDLRKIRWAVLGGRRADTIAVADLYKTTFSAEIVIQQTDWRTAELTKYMENSFLALKVTFCNELYDIAQSLNVDYNELRELWLLDPRIGRSHTFVLPDARGYGGSCLPKDASALIHLAEERGCSPHLLRAMVESNRRTRAKDRGVPASGRDGRAPSN